MDGFTQRVHAVGPQQWANRTPCSDWDIRALVNHLTVEQLWVPPLIAGQTLEQVGDRFEGDQLGADPAATWDQAAAAARATLTAPGAIDRTVHLSYGDRPASAYCEEMTVDLLIHAWDLARGIGADEALDPELVDLVYQRTLPYAERLAESGLFAPPVSVAPDADPQTRLLALFGRGV